MGGVIGSTCWVVRSTYIVAIQGFLKEGTLESGRSFYPAVYEECSAGGIPGEQRPG